jgi:hypothetical protein
MEGLYYTRTQSPQGGKKPLEVTSVSQVLQLRPIHDIDVVARTGISGINVSNVGIVVAYDLEMRKI